MFLFLCSRIPQSIEVNGNIDTNWVNPFQPSLALLHPMKTLENQGFKGDLHLELLQPLIATVFSSGTNDSFLNHLFPDCCLCIYLPFVQCLIVQLNVKLKVCSSLLLSRKKSCQVSQVKGVK